VGDLRSFVSVQDWPFADLDPVVFTQETGTWDITTGFLEGQCPLLVGACASNYPFQYTNPNVTCVIAEGSSLTISIILIISLLISLL
jgi:hypothetical protein